MGARWYDPSLARWLSADTLVPESGNPQTFNRYSWVLGNPIRYTDPTGYFSEDEIREYLWQTYGDHWWDYWIAWQSDEVFWNMLLAAEYEDSLYLPGLGTGYFVESEGSFSFVHSEGRNLWEYQGKGPMTLTKKGQNILDYPWSDVWCNPVAWGGCLGYKSYRQPIYDYSSGVPKFTFQYLISEYRPTGQRNFDAAAGDSVPYVVSAGGEVLGWLVKAWSGPLGVGIMAVSGLTALNNAVQIEYALVVRHEVAPPASIGPMPKGVPITIVGPQEFLGITYYGFFPDWYYGW